MANNIRSIHPTPLLVIDTCPSEDAKESPARQPEQPHLSRSWSLPNCNATYKDLHGAVHHSFANHVNHSLARSRSYPLNQRAIHLRINDKYFHIQSSLSSINLNANWLDPNSGMQTPGASSSRYSLYGSFFDLSESGYYAPSDQRSMRSDNKLLTIGGRPLLIVDRSAETSAAAFQDKCNEWLRQLNTNLS